MDWVAAAEEFCGSYGWGARGKYIGVSRMLNDADKSTLARQKVVISTRPRGILSGFLAIVPSLGYAVYLPPVAARMGPMRIRMRVSDELLREGAIFSAYVKRTEGARVCILEDVLVWKNKSVWFQMPFEERWNGLMQLFVTKEWKNDPALQTISMQLSSYMPLQELCEEEENVVEFVPNAPNQKRMIWIPTAAASTPGPQATKPAEEKFTAQREASMGPDVYSIWRNSERLGIALVRTLAVSRILRGATSEKIPVNASWNKQFEKWEILGTV